MNSVLFKVGRELRFWPHADAEMGRWTMNALSAHIQHLPSQPANQPTHISTTTIASPLQHCHPTTETASPLIPRVLCLCFRSSSFFLVRSKSVAGSTAMNYLSKSFRPRSACGGHTHAATHTDVIRTRGTHVTYQRCVAADVALSLCYIPQYRVHCMYEISANNTRFDQRRDLHCHAHIH